MTVKIKWIIVFVLSVLVNNLYAQNTNFKVALNLANFGWGMDLSSDEQEGNITYNLLNLYVEHRKTGIGIEISPFSSWVNYSHTKILMSFVNVNLYYNLVGEQYHNDDEEKEEKIDLGSTYILLGPFVSLNYLMAGNDYSFDPNNYQINIGFKALTMLDASLFSEGSLPVGFQLLSIELGYRFASYGTNNHRFYFNFSTDLLPLIFIMGLIMERPEQKRDVR
jgi:hypothetical protein